MTDLAQARQARPDRRAPSPASMRPRRPGAAAASSRASARAALDDALSGVELSPVDRRFLVRLSQWDKRSAASVAALISRARESERAER